MKRFLFWQRWLFGLSIFLIIIGIVMALFSSVGVFTLLDSLVNPVFWESGDVGSGVGAFQQWIYGLLGAVMAGWGVTLSFLASYPFRQREKWSWYALVLSLFVWYVPDTAVSLLFGVFFNAISNTVLLGLFLWPLMAARPYFFQTTNAGQSVAA